MLSAAPSRALQYTRRGEEDLPCRFIFFRLRKHARDFLQGASECRLILMPGLRGTGKTTVLWQLYRYLVERARARPERILFLPVDELRELVGGSIYEAVECYEELIGSRLEELEDPVFFLLDEVTYDPKWPAAVKAIYDRTPRAFIVVSGSSALALQVTPDLARRGVKEILFPMSLAEYLILKGLWIPPRDFVRDLKAALFESGSPEEALGRLEALHRELLGMGHDLHTLVTHYLKFGGLPFTMWDGERAYERVYDVIDRVVNKDFSMVYRMKPETRARAMAILAGLATQPPAPVSASSLAQNFGIKYETARRVLEAFVDSLILYEIPPYARGFAQVRKVCKYCFATPVIRAALAYRLGWSPEELLGHMLEDAVLSALCRLKATCPGVVGVHYDPEKGGADAIVEVSSAKGTVSIPIEAGWGRKEPTQVRRTMRRVGAPYGIVVDDSPKPELEDDVIHVPKYMFLLL